jgi:protocatechuate 3,4-dioxygenase beta subunit
MKKVISLLLLGIISLSLVAVTGAHAQGGAPFSIGGQVVDRYGNPIAGADVTLVDNAYKVLGTMKTNENGNFDFINKVADTETCKVIISYTDAEGKVYKIPPEWSKWYNAKGTITIPVSETTISNYPPPVYGYVYGVIQTDSTAYGNFIKGIVYLVGLDNDVKYYEFAENTDGKGSFQFYVPTGNYMIYAQHWENGVVYESAHKQVTVNPNSDISEVTQTRIILPLTSPTGNPDPAEMPSHHNNKVNGTVLTKDGKPVSGATVTLLQKADNGTGWIPMKGYDGKAITATTNDKGYYEFYGVSPSTNDGRTIQSKKDIKVQVDYTDINGARQTYTASDYRPLYYPDFIMGYGMENAARNITMPQVTLPFAMGGWVSLNSVPTGAYIYVDGQQLFGPDNKPLTTPCTAYIDAGTHQIKMTKDGYTDSVDTITMEANKQHPDFIMSLEKALIPPWVTFAVAVIILLVFAALIIALLATRIKGVMAVFSRLFGGLGHKVEDYRASREVARAHKAEIAEKKRQEQQKAVKVQPRPRPEDDVPVINVDSAKKKAEPKKKILDIDLKHITDSVPRPKKTWPREAADGKEKGTPVVFANDIYKKPPTNVERIPYEAPSRPVDDSEALVEGPERGERFRIPKVPGKREAAGSSLGDKERVLRYIKEHPEGVSFIQMSNDLEIIPNNLTYITKELVINDDIEKVKGLYYYKSHTSPPDEKSSSVVVWRLDGDK